MKVSPLFVTSHLLRSAGILHGFSTRFGGVSPPPFDSLNLGLGLGDEASNVERNLLRLVVSAGLEALGVATVNQVHGAKLCVAPGLWTSAVGDDDDTASTLEGVGQVLGDADAVLSSVEGPAVAVRTADCTPILLASPTGDLVAAVHAGWKGTAAGIVGRVVAALAQAGVRPSTLLAAIGPTIGQASYEVGPEVAASVMGALGLDLDGDLEVCRPGVGDRLHLDLSVACQRQLVAAGVGVERIDRLAIDTFVDGRFFSHRRDRGRTGRQLSFIAPGRAHV